MEHHRIVPSSTSTSTIAPSPDAVVRVPVPTTSVVGHLPVLRDDEIFEYVSGCEIGSKTEEMDGRFRIAWVGEETRCAKVGDPVEELKWGDKGEEEDGSLIEVIVEPFWLVVVS